MSFINPLIDIRRSELDESLLIGEVLDNIDPLHLGRIKVRIKSVFGNKGTTAQLPWATPKRPISFGGGANLSGVSIPDIGSKVYVTFHKGCIYSPVYEGAPLSLTDKWSEMDTNYPNRYGFIDSDGSRLVIDKTINTLTYTHVTGAIFSIGSDGSITITSPVNMNLNATGNINLTAGGDVVTNATGDINSTATGNMTLIATRIDENP